jgi:hypothetical protein
MDKNWDYIIMADAKRRSSGNRSNMLALEAWRIFLALFDTSHSSGIESKSETSRTRRLLYGYEDKHVFPP